LAEDYNLTKVDEKIIIPQNQLNLLEAQAKNSKSQLSLLLVEDNHDFRKILKSHFSQKFQVVEAVDGIQAYKKAIKYVPDIIVSDVMMPGKDGFELCLDLKNNVETSMIPVILLTAKSTDVDKAKGYSLGADSYITKPVSLPLLESRINALLLKRMDIEPVNAGVENVKSLNPKLKNDQFIRQLKKVINENISDVEFQVTEMHSLFGMSNSMFYRRVKELTKKAPVEYVKQYRLNKAADLLKKGNLTIAEIAYSTGFSDQSYFGACFKKHFGLTPSKFVSIKRKKQTYK